MKKLYLLLFAALNFQNCFPAVHVNMLSTPAVISGGNLSNIKSYKVDIDNNGEDDVEFEQFNNTLSGGGDNSISAGTYNGNQLDCTQGTANAVAYSCGAKISFYQQRNSASIGDQNTPANFEGRGGRYLFVYFYDGGNNFKTAWIKIAASTNSDSLTIYGWAYSDDYYDTIKAGQGECFAAAVEDITLLRLSVTQQGNTLKITSSEKFEACLMDATGRVALPLQEGELVMMNISTLPKGIYILYLRDEKKKAFTKKVVL